MKNYIDLLAKEDIENILKENNFVLNENILDRNGAPLPSIEKSDDMIMLRCEKLADEEETSIKNEIIGKMNKKLLMSGLLIASMGSFSALYDSAVIFIENFNIYTFSAGYEENESDEKLAKTFYTYMINKFGKEYINDYKKYYKNLKKQQKQENKTEKEAEERSL